MECRVYSPFYVIIDFIEVLKKHTQTQIVWLCRSLVWTEVMKQKFMSSLRSALAAEAKSRVVFVASCRTVRVEVVVRCSKILWRVEKKKYTLCSVRQGPRGIIFGGVAKFDAAFFWYFSGSVHTPFQSAHLHQSVSLASTITTQLQQKHAPLPSVTLSVHQVSRFCLVVGLPVTLDGDSNSFSH